MFRTLLHKTLLTAIAVLLGGWAVVAQQNVVKGTALSFKADENTAIDFRWEIYSVDAGTTINLISDTNITEEYTFSIEGNYEVKAYPVDLVTRCLGEPIVIQVAVIGDPPTLVFEDLSDTYACSASNGDNPRAEISCTVTYTGPLPWTFKYSIDREPAEMPEDANEIWTKSFDFVITIPNTTGGRSTSEIMIVEAMSISGLKVVEDTDEHSKQIDILPLPDTKFIDFEATVMAGTLQSYSANILRHDANSYEIFLPDGASVLNENTTLLADELHSELTFDIQWGTELGAKQVKLIERSAFNCYGDTVYADVNVLEFIEFSIELGDDKFACINDDVILNPEPKAALVQDYKYLWSNGDDTPTITVTEPGTYSVVVTDESNNVKRDEINVTFNPLPIVDLGADRSIPEGESITLDAGVSDGSSYLWNNGSDNQTIDVSAEGEYWVQITDNNECINRDTITLTIGSVLTVDLGDFIEICEGDRAYLRPTLNVEADDVTYNWIPGGETEQEIYATKKGKYCVEVTDNLGNKETACVDVIINAGPIVDLGDDIKLDVGQIVELDAGNDGVSYVWSTNEITSTIEVSSSGNYSVEVTGTTDCIGRDSVNVYSKGRRYLPSGFSPNGDGRNDLLTVKEYDNVKAITFIIYNRGGQKIFQSNRLDIGWDGAYKGELQRMDTYVYFLEVTLDDNNVETQRGEVTLLR
ncbi:MAG: gliding motility-associated-like protein [Ancylomarina sp.]|jgi:gliding motility-associated-like protein